MNYLISDVFETDLFLCSRAPMFWKKEYLKGLLEEMDSWAVWQIDKLGASELLMFKQTMDLRINFLNDGTKIFQAFRKIILVYINDQ